MKIFISYRRDDSAGYAGRLFDYLAARFGSQNVFMDIDTIQPGDDFRKVVRNAVGTCDVVLVMIGKQWQTIVDGQGRRRLEDHRDWVRVEIATALANPNVRVIPVLVRGASMPDEHDLPEDLKELSWRNALELSDSRFQHDAGKLVSVIERTAKRPGVVGQAGRQKSVATRYLSISAGIISLGLVIGAAWYGLRIFGTSPSTTPTPAFTSTYVPEIPPKAGDAMTAAPTAFSAPTGTATELPLPTFTPSPEPTVDVSMVVVQLVDNYFSCVNAAVQDHQEDFLKCWNLLSDRPNEFRDYLNKHSGGFEAFYSNYWNKYKVSYALYYCPYQGQYYVDAIHYYRDRNNPSVLISERNVLEFYLAQDNEGWRIAGANNKNTISSYCENQPRVDKLNIFQ